MPEREHRQFGVLARKVFPTSHGFEDLFYRGAQKAGFSVRIATVREPLNANGFIMMKHISTESSKLRDRLNAIRAKFIRTDLGHLITSQRSDFGLHDVNELKVTYSMLRESKFSIADRTVPDAETGKRVIATVLEKRMTAHELGETHKTFPEEEVWRMRVRLAADDITPLEDDELEELVARAIQIGEETKPDRSRIKESSL